MVQNQRFVLAGTLFVTVIALVALAVQESGVPVLAAEEKPLPKTPWSVEYHDGSGNSYRFWKATKRASARFEYAPVQPENSSSGIYSGGKPQKGPLAIRGARELWRRVRKLEATTSLHAPSRIMGTGSFVLKEPQSRERKFLINGGSAIKEFDTFLTPYRKGK